MIQCSTTFTTIVLAGLLILPTPLYAQVVARLDDSVEQSARYGSVSSNQVFSIVTCLNDALMTLSQVRKSTAFEQIQKITLKTFTNKTPENVFVRNQHLCGLIDQMRQDTNLGAIPRITREQDTAIPAEVYLIAANCLDGLMELVVQENMGKAMGGLQRMTEFTGKTPSDVYGLIELAVERLEAYLGLTPSLNSGSSPELPTNTESLRVRPRERYEPDNGSVEDEAVPLMSIPNHVAQKESGLEANSDLSRQSSLGVSAPASRAVPYSRDTAVPVEAPERMPTIQADLTQRNISRARTNVVAAARSSPEPVTAQAPTAIAQTTITPKQRVLTSVSDTVTNTTKTQSIRSAKRTDIRRPIAPLVSAEPAPVRAPRRFVSLNAQQSPAVTRTPRLNVAPPPVPAPRQLARSTNQPVTPVLAAENKKVVSAGMVNNTKLTKNGAQEAIKRPKKVFLRQNEDWSVLAAATDEQKTDWWDSIKYVPLSKDGDIWASFGGHARLRLEDWSEFAFGAPAIADDTFLLWRLMLHSDIHFGDNIRAYVEGKSALATDRKLPGGRRAGLDSDSLALQQAFLDVKIPMGDNSLTIRGGRQMFLFGKQRLVSPLPWANNLRAWDGVSGIANIGGWKFHSFYSHFVPVRKHDFNQEDAQTEFYGVYANGKILDDKIKMDAYFLGLEKEGPITFNGTSGAEDRYTLGARLSGKFGDTTFDYDVEGAYQFGEVGTADIAAYMLASEIGYKAANLPGAPRFKIGFDYASGDETAGDGDVETFNQLFPLGHAYFGYMDFVARQNVIDISPGVSLKPTDKITLAATGHMFWRAENEDALYNAGGGVVRGGGLGTEDEIGSEIDLILKYKFNRHLLGVLGYSHFFAGDFIEESGSSDDMDFVYAQLQYTF